MSEPVTKADLEAAIEAAVRSIKEYVDLRINDAVQSMKQYVDLRINDAVQSMKEYVDQRTYDAETRLLRGFADYNVAIGTRMRKIESDNGNIDASTSLRLTELERRMTELDFRTIRLEGQK